MSIGSNLLRYSDKQKFVCADFETTGLVLHDSTPWQLAYDTFTLKDNLSSKNRYIWWSDLQVSKQAAIVTGFNYDTYKEKAEDPIKILEEFEDILYSKEYKVISQNWLGYDSMILNVMRRKLGKKEYYDYLYQPYKAYDTLALSKAIKKSITPDISSSNAFLAWQYKMLSLVEKGLKCSLGAMGKELQINFDEKGLHNAANDVMLNIEVFRKQVWSLELI